MGRMANCTKSTKMQHICLDNYVHHFFPLYLVWGFPKGVGGGGS